LEQKSFTQRRLIMRLRWSVRIFNPCSLSIVETRNVFLIGGVLSPPAKFWVYRKLGGLFRVSSREGVVWVKW
jgi:hypothetical protein